MPIPFIIVWIERTLTSTFLLFSLEKGMIMSIDAIAQGKA